MIQETVEKSRLSCEEGTPEREDDEILIKKQKKATKVVSKFPIKENYRTKELPGSSSHFTTKNILDDHLR